MFMRKEVRLGLSIGGVLLAVIIVYLLVVTAGSDKPQTVSLDQPQNTGSPTGAQPPAPAPSGPTETRRDGPLVAPPPASRPALVSDAPGSGGTDPWSTALATGHVPVMLTETPAQNPPSGPGAPINPGPASANQSTGSLSSGSLAGGTSARGGSEPIAASNVGSSITSGGSNSWARPTTGESLPGTGAPGTGASGAGAPGAGASGTSPRDTGSNARTHVVKEGETYASIAKAVYGNESYYPHLIRANPTIEARRLRPGMTISVPPVSEVRADTTARPGSAAQQAAAPQAPLDTRTEYRVGEGDSLEKISLKLYGKRDRTEKLYELNKSTIGADPARLKIGMVLKLPEPPTTVR
jgi:nucleoid-associated protein YgaU